MASDQARWRGVKCPKCNIFLTGWDPPIEVFSTQQTDDQGDFTIEVLGCPHCGHEWARTIRLVDIDAE